MSLLGKVTDETKKNVINSYFCLRVLLIVLNQSRIVFNGVETRKDTHKKRQNNRSSLNLTIRSWTSDSNHTTDNSIPVINSSK